MSISAQNYSFKYGKITNDELSITSLPEDSTASAAVIYKKVNVRYESAGYKFYIIYDYEIKIKILNDRGIDRGNVVIQYYNKDSSLKESIGDIEACSYNKEDGKIIKTELNKKYIFDERINYFLKRIKFAIPEVKVGSVIEYKYKLTSNLSTKIPNWVIQENIPVVNAEYQIRIPEFYHFNIETRGSIHPKVEENMVNSNFMSMNGDIINYSSRELNFKLENIPAIGKESYIWYPDDYKAQISFELKGIKWPNEIYKSYTTTWEDLNEYIKTTEFGEALKLKNPFQEEMKALNLDSLSSQNKIRAIFKLLQAKIHWNNKYDFLPNNIKKTIQYKTGTNAEINFILISMLKNAGFEAYPVMIRLRNNGKLPFSYPSFDKLNTFVVGIKTPENDIIYIDASIKKGDINILPPCLMVERGRIFDKSGDDAWVDLTKVGKNTINIVTQAAIDKNGLMTGKITTFNIGQYATLIRKNFTEAKDSTTFIENLAKKTNSKIKEYQIKEINDMSSCVIENYAFTKELASKKQSKYFFTPFIIRHITFNPFKSTKRELPIEFNHPQEFRITCSITLPEGFEVESLPKASKVQLDDLSCSYAYNIELVDNQLILRYQFKLNRTLFCKEEYPYIQAIWESMINKNMEYIVIKKSYKTTKKEFSNTINTKLH